MARRQKFSIFRTLSNLLILAGVIFLAVSFWPVISAEAKFQFNKLRGVKYEISEEKAESPTLPQFERSENLASPRASNFFGDLLKIGPKIEVSPVDKNGCLIIEKINVNAPIIFDVPVADKKEYWEALKHGVAHAKETPKPGEVGNSYLFAHSTPNPWEIEKYSAVFTLLHKLEIGDRIVTFVNGERIDFIVSEKQIVPSFDTNPLLRHFDEPALTLQTCHPPGIPLNRLIITAKMAGRYEI